MMLTRRGFFLAGPLLAVSMAAAAQTPSVTAEHAWARATAGMGRTAAVYLTLRAEGGADRLIGAATPRAGMAMLHESFDDHGVARMRMLDGVDLPAGQNVTLRPGALHIMLTGLAHPLAKGDSFPLTLSFAKAPALTVTVAVAAPGAGMPPGGAAMPGMKMQ